MIDDLDIEILLEQHGIRGGCELKKVDKIHPALCAEIARRMNGARQGEKQGIIKEYMKTFGLSKRIIYKITKKYAWTLDV